MLASASLEAYYAGDLDALDIEHTAGPESGAVQGEQSDGSPGGQLAH